MKKIKKTINKGWGYQGADLCLKGGRTGATFFLVFGEQKAVCRIITANPADGAGRLGDPA